MGSSGLSRRRALTGAAGVGISLPVLAACGGGGGGSTATDPSSSSAPSTSPSTSASGGGAPAEGFTTTADIPVGGGAVFPDEGVVVTQPTEGEFKGFAIQCTHAGCPVDEVTETINCPCHASQFSITDGAPQSGPASEPLGEMPLTVTGDQISLA